MFRKILIANRGEIACRVIRTGQAPGHRARSRSIPSRRATRCMSSWPTRRCASAPRRPRESYLDIDEVIAAARATGAEAIHPGYGFLSENAALRRGLRARPASSSSARPPRRSAPWAASREAKALMEKAGVPLVPGYHGDDQAIRDLLARGRAHRLPGADQGLGRRRRQGHARRRRRRVRAAALRSTARSARPSPRSATTGC